MSAFPATARPFPEGVDGTRLREGPLAGDSRAASTRFSIMGWSKQRGASGSTAMPLRPFSNTLLIAI